MLFSTLKNNNIEKCPFTYWLNGRWFLQIVDGDILFSLPVSQKRFSVYLYPKNGFQFTLWHLTLDNLVRTNNFKNLFLQNFMFSSCFMLFPTLKKNWCKKNNSGGGGGVFFLEKQFFLISRFMLFSTLKINNIEKCPFTYWLNGRWFLQIVDGDSWNIYPLYILYSFVLILYLKFGVVWGGGGGVMFFSHFMLFPTFLEKNLGIQTNYFSFNVFFVFFCMLQNIKVPLHLQLLVKWEVVSPNSRYRAFYHEIGNIEKCPFTYWLNGGGGFSNTCREF